MMKILFIELPIDSWNRFSRLYIPNPGTLAVGTYLKNKGYSVKILDTYAEGIGWKNLKEIIKEESPDIVGASSYTPDIYGRILLARLIKQISPSTVTVLGGAHATLVPEETLRLGKAIDYLVIGEGEETFLELVKTLERGGSKEDMRSVKGLAYLFNGEYIKTRDRPFINDLDELPMPDYSMLPMDKYGIFYFPYVLGQSLACTFSRGCAAPCVFCSTNVVWRHCWRGRSAKKIVEELAVLSREYKKKTFLFADDNFLYDRDRNKEFINQMRAEGLEIEFRLSARVDSLLRDKDLLKDLRSVGLTALQIGVESYDQDVIDGLSKNYRVERVKELASILKEAGIPFSVLFFIVGNYEDSRGSLLRIVEKTKEYGFGAIHISPLTPWPGTQLHSRMESLIKVRDYRDYDWKNTIMPTKHLSIKQINRLRNRLFFKWYFAPSVFRRNLSNKYLKRYHLSRITSFFFSAVRYKLIRKLQIWRLFWYNRLIEKIYKEHMSFIKKGKGE
ncbi:MAG: radical SAM protein [Candidatus Omnitrophica bacterium]|nr:radical SAM protein [Candidatus Omnitrophota bacterium]MDD5553793.1 radical SAM protein [Candidatus Omnitrophota bacterium]